MAQITSVYGLDSKYTIHIYIHTHDIYVCIYEGTAEPCNTFIIVVVEIFFHERNKSFYTLTMSGTGALITLAYDIACNI